MIQKLLNLIFGSKYERDIKRISPIVQQVLSFEEEMQKLSLDELKMKTTIFKERLSKGQSLDDVLPEAFAAVREVSWRVLGMKHFKVQVMGGVSLHWGNISEMKTGEGKTLTATLSIYLNALSGKGVHVVTVNDYLAKRDANWMRPIYESLGLTVGIIQHDLTYEQRKTAYNSDITYGTNNEFGFDYLRDNMVSHLDHRVQRGHNYAIVDEVDSILIDESRTPLIISGPTDETTDKYVKINAIIPKLKGRADFGVAQDKPKEQIQKDEIVWDYEIDEKAKNALLTEVGVKNVEKFLNIDNLYEPENVELVHHVNQGLRAHKIYIVDVDYVVQNGEVLIVDEFTGRLMPGRRYSDGLHQALEAKEGVEVAKESQTLASITFQNFFRIYGKLAGMTGTADTEAEEFAKIYKLDVIVIPPNLINSRVDHPDRVYRTEREKFVAIVKELKDLHTKKRPVLVGTISIERSEVLSQFLKREGIPHNVLNAKYHEKEAEIIANAGKLGAITIATNMAGRGTDIILGGTQRYKEDVEVWEDQTEPLVEDFKNAIKKLDFEKAESISHAFPSQAKKKRSKEILDDAKLWIENHEKVVGLGGLHILGTERHESRRIDNQLRGRAGRQGDPGSSRFYLSLEDGLMRIFGSDRISSIMQKLGMEEGQEIEHKLVTSAIARSQKRVEAHNFDIRKHLLEYDDVMNKQRMFIYSLRNEIIENKKEISEIVKGWIEDVIETQILIYCEGSNPSAWDINGLNEWLLNNGIRIKMDKSEVENAQKPQVDIFEKLCEKVVIEYKNKAQQTGQQVWNMFERNFILDILDHRWKDHLYVMDHLREGIWTVGYGDKNPLVEYKIQGFKIFDAMIENYKSEIITFLFKLEITEKAQVQEDREYKVIGEETTNLDIFSSSLSDINSQKRKHDSSSHSSGGASQRKSSKRRKR